MFGGREELEDARFYLDEAQKCAVPEMYVQNLIRARDVLNQAIAVRTGKSTGDDNIDEHFGDRIGPE